MGMVLEPLSYGYFFNLDRCFRTGGHTSGRLAVLQPSPAHVTLRYDIPFRIKLRDPIWAIPGAILTTDTLFRFMFYNTCFFVFNISIRGTTGKARGIKAVIAGHGKMETFRIRINAALDFPDTPPIDRCRIVVLFVTGHHTALTADTKSHVKVETILLPFQKRLCRD